MQDQTSDFSPKYNIGNLEDKTALPDLRSAEAELSAEYDTAFSDVPASSPSGGDFHNTFPVHDGSGDVAVVMGDVVGHGPEQTPQADHMRELLSDCLSVGLTPAETLGAVNAMIEPDPNFEGFGTVFVGTLNAGTGKLTYASGGHEPALITSSEEANAAIVKELDGTGPPVGAFPPEIARFEQREATLPKGGTLLLYTDGIPDARAPHDRKQSFGLERLKGLFARVAALQPRQMVSEIMGRIAAFCQGRFHDDAAVLAIRRRRNARRQETPKAK